MEVRQAGSLQGERIGLCPPVRAERWLRCFVHPFAGGECRRHVQYPAFAPKFCFCSNTLFLLSALQKWYVVGGFFFFCLFVSSCHKFALTANAQSNF